ncbi:MAG: DUF4921 family protein [Candidatus Schekmanbacteria bacterium]|nr:DUF4921 family protein [Candidatus Schekmanbacteria bacterium]
MSELRHDPISQRWVIIAPARASRPTDFGGTSSSRPRAPRCPFCPGNEDDTPPPVAVTGPEMQGESPHAPWLVRVVPNKYPAVGPEISARFSAGPRPALPAQGIHEVIVETPLHDRPLTMMSDPEVTAVAMAYRSRVADAASAPFARSVMLFKNHGADAGASLAHPHAQLISLPIVPELLATELRGTAAYHAANGVCPYCAAAAASPDLLVAENELFLAYCPWVSRVPYEVWLQPRRHDPDFAAMTEHEPAALGRLLRDVLIRIGSALQTPAYNYFLHTAPVHGQAHPTYHWHLEILPRLCRFAGFEWGSGFSMNHVPPELAAERLRAVST